LGRLDDVATDFAELSLLGLSLDELNTVLTRVCNLVSQAQGLQFAAIQEAEAADDFAWPEWKQMVAYWLNAADPDGELSDPPDPKLGMRVRTRANGNVVVTIEMDPITGEAFLTMHDAEVKKLERNERERLNEHPNSPITSDVQKNLDALLRLMARG